MSKLSDRLNDYQTQMSIYAEQHKLILASDVLDMIEQLQDDLKDDIKNVVAELEKEKEIHTNAYNISLYKDYPDVKQRYEQIQLVIDDAINKVRKCGAE